MLKQKGGESTLVAYAPVYKTTTRPHCSLPPLLWLRLVHICVGTPGRLCALLQAGSLPSKSVSTLVLDEADTLLSDAFYSDVTWVYDQLPKRKQVGSLKLQGVL